MKTLLTFIMLFLSLICVGKNKLNLDDLNLKNFNMNFKEYHQSTALYCGNLSEMAYWNFAEISKMAGEINAKYPLNPVKVELVEDKKSDAQALLYCTKDFLVISFRGTQPSKLRDIISDLKFWDYANNPSQNETLANMPIGHGGFRRSLINLITDQNIFQRIDELILSNNPHANLKTFPIYTTGHSLGAALSQFFMESLRYKSYNFSGAYHFAPPLAVDCSENEFMRVNFGNKVYDIVNYKDFVSRAGRNGVAHFGKFYRICLDGLLYEEPDAYVKFNGLQYFKVFKYHKLDNYLSAIRKPTNNIGEIEARSKSDHIFPCMGNDITKIGPCNN